VWNRSRGNILRLGVLLILICLTLGPLFVFSATLLDWRFGSGRFTSQLDLLPKKYVLLQFARDMLSSGIVVFPLSLVLLVDYFLFAHRRSSRILFGLVFIASVIITSIYFFPNTPYAIVAAACSAVVTAICAKIYIALFLPVSRISRYSDESDADSVGDVA